METEQIVKADPKARQLVLAFLLIGLLVGAFLVAWLLPFFKNYLTALPPVEALETIRVVLVILFLGVAPAGIYIFWIGGKVAKTKCFPPPGMKVIRDTRIVTGPKAVTRGAVLMIMAVVVILLGVIGAGFTWFSLESLVKLQ